MVNGFTLDNSHLSELKTSPQNDGINEVGEGVTLIAINCKSALTGPVADYVHASRAPNTLKAYATDLASFIAWGGTIPASPVVVANYLAEKADSLKPATLSRHLASIAVAHRAKAMSSPTTDELVRSVMKGIRRTKGTAQREAKPLLKEDLFVMLDAMGDDMKSIRDRSLLLLGFAGGFRRSELVGLNVDDLAFVRQGAIITLRQSKTDQLGQGRKIGIPFGRTKHCPVRATENWLQAASLTSGPIYRPIGKGGHMADQRLSGDAVCHIIRAHVAEAGFAVDGYSGHSLRSGFATSAAIAGVATWRIRKQTGHASDATLSRYIRDRDLFEGNASGMLL
jgi:site-specific recombinase XerD